MIGVVSLIIHQNNTISDLQLSFMGLNSYKHFLLAKTHLLILFHTYYSLLIIACIFPSWGHFR